jgi:hypothetical protein
MVETTKVFVKNEKGGEGRWLSADQLRLNRKSIEDIINKLTQVEKTFESLIEELKECYIVKKDKEYIIDIENDLKRVKDIKLYEVQDLKLPLKFYQIENCQIVVNKMKVGAL